MDAIKSDLNLSKKQINKIIVHKCLNCNILQNNPWFKKEISEEFIQMYMDNIIEVGLT